ncbi:MAG: bifunctional precorrin-2 dehydrogenase/sirohydrochlorin ferrochelatase [Eubacterium ramulus]
MEKEQRYFPFFVDISEYRVLVVGAGIIALRRTSALSAFWNQGYGGGTGYPCRISGTAGAVWAGVCLPAAEKFTPGMTTGYDIVLAATDSPETDHSIWEECKKHGIRVSVASDQTLCDFRFPALIEKDNIVVGVTSNDSDHRNVREISARIRETLGTENRNIDRAEKQDSKESEYQRKEMSAGRTGSEEKNQ